MKKTLFLAGLSLFLLAGCGSNKVVCTGTNSDGTNSAKEHVVIYVKDGIVTDIDETLTFDDEDFAKQSCETNKSLFSQYAKVKCSKKKVRVTDLEDLFKAQKLKIEDYKSQLEAAGLTCK